MQLPAALLGPNLIQELSGWGHITDALNHLVRRIDSAGVVRPVAGNGTMGYSGDGSDAKLAQLNEPHRAQHDPQDLDDRR